MNFLIVYDFVKYAKKNNIYVGPGRGSAGASLVGFSLGITDIDPIYHKLLFERFLNKERISMPDIDIDFEDDRRDEGLPDSGTDGNHSLAHEARRRNPTRKTGRKHAPAIGRRPQTLTHKKHLPDSVRQRQGGAFFTFMGKCPKMVKHYCRKG